MLCPLFLHIAVTFVIIKYSVFHTRAGKARLKNSVAIFQFI